MITHDLAAARRIADRVAVMYAGRIVELTDAQAFFGTPGPRHPYSRGLLRALPDRAFTAIPGMPPELGNLPRGCAFAPAATGPPTPAPPSPSPSTEPPATTRTSRRATVLELHDITAGYDPAAPVVRDAAWPSRPARASGSWDPAAAASPPSPGSPPCCTAPTPAP